MTYRRHSSVFDFLTAVTTAVQEATYPPSPVTNRLPWLDTQGLAPETADEFVSVNQTVDDGTIEWVVLSPGGRNETASVDIVIGTAIPGRSKLEVIDRLAELAGVVQGLFYDPETFTFTPPDVDGALGLGGFTGVSTVIEASDRGHVGRAVLRYEFIARI